MPILRAILFFFTIVIGVAAVSAMEPKDALEQGVKAGEQAPELQAVSATGAPVSLDDIMGENGVVLLFVRSADWCSYCKGQLRDWNVHAGRFRDAGYPVVSISYDDPARLRTFIETAAIDYPMLSDPNSETIRAFGIMHEGFEKGSRFYGIPRPAIYVIEPDGNIAHRFTEKSYKERPEIQRVAEALGLNKEAAAH